MYVARPLSQLRKFPELVSEFPDGPNSGYLVIQDEESETYSFFGLFKNHTVKELLFPQNKELTVRYTTNSTHANGNGHSTSTSSTSSDPVFLIPALNQPLNRNRYYAIAPHGKHKGIDPMEEASIYKVSDRLAYLNRISPIEYKTVYKPLMVSIGPYHHGDWDLRGQWRSTSAVLSFMFSKDPRNPLTDYFGWEKF